MKFHHFKKLFHRYYTLNNVVVIVALLIALSWLWGTMEALQKNFTLQQEVDNERQEVELLDLEAQTLAFEKRYYESDEYLELSARERLGLAAPGEKMLILPENTTKDELTKRTQTRPQTPTNFQQWMIFLFGTKEE